mgnify:CR=1 FL=1
MKTIVSEKGQITIPKNIRERMGLHKGTILEIEEINGKIIAVKGGKTDVFSKWKGACTLPGGLSVDEYLERVRE